MSESPDAGLLSACQLEIEHAWNASRDDAPVHRLAAAHPELAEELYEFFASVIEAEDGYDRPRPESAAMDRRVRELLEQSRASARPSATKPFLALIRAASDETVDAIATSMEVTPDFLVDASDHGSVLPLAVRQELVRRVGRVRLTREIETGEAIASFDVSSKLRRAASRDGAYEPDDTTFRDIVEGSTLGEEEQRFWLGLA